MCDAAQKYIDLKLLRFIKKYGENPCFFHTGQMIKFLLYTILQGDYQSYYKLCNSEILTMYLAFGVSPSYIKILIENGANADYKDTKVLQATPLMNVCIYGSYETVKMLLDAGADPRHKTIGNQSTLFLAFKHNSCEVFFMIYNALFQRNASESELLQYFILLPPMIKNIIKQTQGDRVMVKVIQRLFHYIDGQRFLNARGLGYSLEKLSNYDHVDELATNLLGTANNRNDSQVINALLHILYHQKKSQVVLNGFAHAGQQMCRPTILNLYVRYFSRLGVYNLQPCQGNLKLRYQLINIPHIFLTVKMRYLV